MDTLTHALVGVAISRAGFKDRVPFATTALVIAANLPDVDGIFAWNGVLYLHYHRGLTHSLLAWPVWTVLVALGLRYAARRRAERRRQRLPSPAVVEAGRAGGGPPVRSLPIEDLLPPEAAGAKYHVPGWGVALLLGALGVGSHLLLDWTNGFGVRLLAPFSRHWFALDIEPIVDPWIWVLLLLFLLAPMVLGLVGGEIGARERPHRASAALALVLLGVWCGWRIVNHDRALAWLGTQTFSGAAPLSLAAFPVTGTPRQWRAVISLPDRYELADVDTSDLRITNLAPQTIFKPAPSPAILMAESTPAGQVFLDFARFPLAMVGRDENGTIVLLTDLRYKSAFAPVRMGLVVREDRRLSVQSTRFYWHGAGAQLPGENEEQ